MNVGKISAIVTVILIALAALAFIVVSQTPPLAADTGWTEVSIGTWKFRHTIVAADPSGNYMIAVDYPAKSTADIQAAVAAMDSHAADILRTEGSLKATIVFKRPLSVPEFTKFVADVGISPTGSIVRALQPDGTRITIGVPPVWAPDPRGIRQIGQSSAGQPAFDIEAYNRVVNNIKSLKQTADQTAEPKVLGVISTDTTLTRSEYAKVRQMPDVFAVDVLKDAVIRSVKKQNSSASPNKIQVRDSNLYWAMEDVGLATSTY